MSSEQAIITVLCMIYRGDEILLQHRIAENWPGITFPGGHVEGGEPFVEAVCREMREETGLTIHNPRICGVKQSQSGNDERYVVLLFKTHEFEGELRSSSEGKMRWYKRSELFGIPLVPDFFELLEVFDRDEVQELVYLPGSDGEVGKIELY